MKANTITQLAGLLIACQLLVVSCRKESNDQDYQVFFPSNFPAHRYDLMANPVTKEGFELGKRLFYDPILSRDSSTSCGSCHNQFSAFTHSGHVVSHGIDNLLGNRNSLPVQNLIWKDDFFWDGGVFHLDLVPLNAITNPVELDEDPAIILEKLRRSTVYPEMFRAAYGTTDIDSQRFLRALSQFMAMLVSANSRYDKYVRQEDNEQLSAEELAGLQTFQNKCASCHATDLFTDFSYRNNGIKDNFDNDQGRYRISLNPGDIGKFKVPSLRNVEVTGPYMHDGSISTLEEVLDHYDQGVLLSPSLDTLLTQNGQLGIPLTQIEKQNIIAFLRTLTDMEFLQDPRFGE